MTRKQKIPSKVYESPQRALRKRQQLKIDELMAINAQQAELIRRAAERGAILFLDPTKVNDEMTFDETPPPEVVNVLAKYTIPTVEYVLRFVRQITPIMNEITAVTNALMALSLANDGPQSRLAAGRYVSRFYAALKTFDIASKLPENPLVDFNWTAFESTVSLWRQLNDLAEQWATAGNNTTEKHNALREFVAQYEPPLKDAFNVIRDHIADFAKRGRKKDGVLDYIGEMARKFPEPKRGEFYLVGEQIIALLKQIPAEVRTKTQVDALADLEHCASQGRSTLGERVSECRKRTID